MLACLWEGSLPPIAAARFITSRRNIEARHGDPALDSSKVRNLQRSVYAELDQLEGRHVFRATYT